MVIPMHMANSAIHNKNRYTLKTYVPYIAHRALAIIIQLSKSVLICACISIAIATHACKIILYILIIMHVPETTDLYGNCIIVQYPQPYYS